MLKNYKTIQVILTVGCFLMSLHKGLPAQPNGSSSTMFRAINCRVLDGNDNQLPVVAYRSMKNRDEVILISKTANHALIANFKDQKVFKVTKPLLGTNAVYVPDERPEHSGNLGFLVRKDKDKKEIIEIIVYFKNESCFLCGSTTFASIWE